MPNLSGLNDGFFEKIVFYSHLSDSKPQITACLKISVAFFNAISLLIVLSSISTLTAPSYPMICTSAKKRFHQPRPCP